LSYLREHDEHVAAELYTGWSLVTVTSYLGTITVTECDACGYLEVFCDHDKNSWDFYGQRLTCDLCGTDGT
jgi:hypothetical protein